MKKLFIISTILYFLIGYYNAIAQNWTDTGNHNGTFNCPAAASFAYQKEKSLL